MLPEIRELRYFVAVAEERRFTHAAERLYITQQSLSAAIAQLERRLGVELFVRDRQGLRLTPAGEALLTAARGILAQAAERGRGHPPRAPAPRRCASATRCSPRRSSRRRSSPICRPPSPSWRSACAWPTTTTRRPAWPPATADVALVRRPDRRALRVRGPVRRGPRGGAAARASAGGRRLGRGRGPRGRRRSSPTPGPTPSGAPSTPPTTSAAGPPDRGVEVGSFDEELATVALGRAIAFTSAAAARLYPRPDLAYVPLAGAAPCTVALAWDPERPPIVLASLLAAARRAREQARADGSFELYGWR